jgi:hypothetical protein
MTTTPARRDAFVVFGLDRSLPALFLIRSDSRRMGGQVWLLGANVGGIRQTVLAACLVATATASAAAQEISQPLADEAAAPPTTYDGPFPYEEREPVVSASPAGKVSIELPAGTTVRDYEASPAGDEAVVVLEDAAHRQRVAFWRFDGGGFARGVDVPAQTSLSSATWHPQGRAVFLLATGAQGSQILRLDAAATTFAPRQVFASAKPLRRLVVGPRPFQIGDDKTPSYRLFFGERRPDGGYSLRTVSENGKAPYTVAGPQADPEYRGRADEERPNTVIAPFALPLAFHPAGNMLIWEDGKKCLHKLAYRGENWGKPEPFAAECGHTVTYTPNGIATIDWQPGRPGIRIRGLMDRSDAAALGEYTFDGIPSHVPDGKGVVAVTSANGRKALAYLPVSVPLANVTNAWMYIEKPADLAKFAGARGLFRPLPKSEQLYQLYDSESYLCGEPDVRTPTRPYFVTTDLFWELYGAAFDGLFIIAEREQATPAFARFVTAADDQLKARHPGTAMAKAFASARAVLEGHPERDPEARLIIEAKGDYAEYKPRGHYTSAEQKRYFGAVRYLSQLKLSPEDTALLRGLDPAVGQAAQAWNSVYPPFIASSRLALVWGGEAGTIASHAGATGTRLFPLSWGWDNEALDNVVFHSAWSPAEQIRDRDGAGRMLPSGLDFAAIAGNRLARDLLDRSGVLGMYPNLAPRIEATRKRFQAATGWRTAGPTPLYDGWIEALAIQWADMATDHPGGIAGPLWSAKRLQTGLASWTTLRHATVLVNDKTAAECGEGGFETIVLRPPRGYVEPDPATFRTIASLFDSTIRTVQAMPNIARDGKIDAKLRSGIIRRLTESRDNTIKYQRIAEKELRGEPLSVDDYQLIQYVGRAAEHNFLVFTSLSNPKYALQNPEPMMKIADVADAPGATLEQAVGRPLEWDQVVPFFGRQEIVKGSVYSWYEFASAAPLDDAKWRDMVDDQKRPDWVAGFMSDAPLSCPAKQP